MAATIAPVSHPNQNLWAGELFGMKYAVYDVTLDSSYLTTGEIVTAAQLGWDQVHGVITLYDFAVSDGTLSLPAVVRPNSTRTQVHFIAQETAATVDTPMKEVTSGFNASTYTGRYIFLGT